MKCTLCPRNIDHQFFISVHDGYYGLCDGCAPCDSEDDIERVSDACREVGPPRTDIQPKFGFNDPREP